MKHLDLDKFVQAKLDSRAAEFVFEEKYWAEMQQLLPAKEKRKRGVLWWQWWASGKRLVLVGGVAVGGLVSVGLLLRSTAPTATVAVAAPHKQAKAASLPNTAVSLHATSAYAPIKRAEVAPPPSFVLPPSALALPASAPMQAYPQAGAGLPPSITLPSNGGDILPISPVPASLIAPVATPPTQELNVPTALPVVAPALPNAAKPIAATTIIPRADAVLLTTSLLVASLELPQPDLDESVIIPLANHFYLNGAAVAGGSLVRTVQVSNGENERTLNNALGAELVLRSLASKVRLHLGIHGTSTTRSNPIINLRSMEYSFGATTTTHAIAIQNSYHLQVPLYAERPVAARVGALGGAMYQYLIASKADIQTFVGDSFTQEQATNTLNDQWTTAGMQRHAFRMLAGGAYYLHPNVTVYAAVVGELPFAGDAPIFDDPATPTLRLKTWVNFYF